MLTGRRYRIGFTAEQAEYAEPVGDACRAVWNTGLEQRRAYRKRGAWINYQEQARQLADAKREHQWLAQAPGHCLQQTLMDLDRACRDHGTWRVRWRSGRRWSPSFRFPEGGKIAVERLNRRWARVKLPKFGWVRVRWSRALGGTIRPATVFRDGNKWYVSLLIEDGATTPQQHTHPAAAVGIDRGVAVAVATSGGELLDGEFITPGEAERIRRLQRQLARREKRSDRWKSTRKKLAALYARVRAGRKDFGAQTAETLTTGNALIVLEDLKTRDMTRTARGTCTEPGRNVGQKAGLNRAILDKGWYQFELALQSKARYTGTRIVKIDPAYTSQTCNACQHAASGSRESQARFRCVACGHSDHPDVNAARNILAAGLAVTGRGDFGGTRSVKRQPTTATVA
ncbi:RNA-guided endonuclease InsQ/TnpB family protein [Nocardia pseudovaccinii]|uniref:RNA-guided endonuclease InsQ/TnpB family protein n=1 Tax=Nocardia pseudovaccinii TaxID=189540 RepID=UPI003D94FD71